MTNNAIPKIYTEDEVIKILRLDDGDVKNPKESLRNIRRGGGLKFMKVAGRIRFTEAQVSEYLQSVIQN